MRRAGIGGSTLVGLVLSGGLLAACGGSGSSTTPGPASPGLPSPSVLVARRSEDPVLAGAGAAYRAAADRYNQTVHTLLVGWDDRIVSQPMTAKIAAHYKAMAAAEQAFAAAIRATAFPSVMRLHVQALIDATDADAELDLKASKTPTGSQVDSTAIVKAQHVSSDAADLIRRDFKVFGLDL